jgi:hypothetical protein
MLPVHQQMITFPCKCGHVFNLTEDMAGGLAQCPRCGLLADVPTLNDLVNLAADGTFKMDEPISTIDENTLGELQHAFAKTTVDSQGEEKDLRPDIDHFASVGVPPVSGPERIAPRYDPVTGELIRPLELKHSQPMAVLTLDGSPSPSVQETEPRPVIPVQAPKSVSYAVGETRKQINPRTLLLELFMPANAFVLFLTFLFSIFALFVARFLAVVPGPAAIILQVLNIPLWLIFAHLAAVIEDTGPDNRDELPRPLRNADISEDLVHPLLSVVISLVLCYSPAIVAATKWIPLGDGRTVAVLILVLLGTVFLPAVLLTTITSGTIVNLTPGRVLGVIASCAGEYILSIAVFLTAIAPFAAVYVAEHFATSATNLKAVRLVKGYTFLPILAISIYLMHYFCWHMGLMYRAHHDSFPWVFQRHIRDPNRSIRRRRR